jgi:hypothetical protein
MARFGGIVRTGCIASVLMFLMPGLVGSSQQSGFRVTEKDNCLAHIHDRVPKYEEVKRVKIKSTHLMYLFVSISPSDDNHDGLIALSCELGKHYTNWDGFEARIYTSRIAAEGSRISDYGDISGKNIPPEVLAARPATYIVFRSGEVVGQSLMYNDDPTSSYATVHVDLGPPPDAAKKMK